MAITTTDLPSRIELQELAFDRVNSAWRWLRNLVRKDDFGKEDEYIASLNKRFGVSGGVMPKAEALMCLLNTAESNYRRIGLPQPDQELIASLTQGLLSEVSSKGYIGVPYLVLPKAKTQPEFTDAVNYVCGALSRLLSTPVVGFKPPDECKHQLLEGTKWILDARIKLESTGEKPDLGGMVAWGWTSPKRLIPALKKEFGKKIPAQTYFTTQALITLCENLFDSYELHEDLAGELLEAIWGARRYLLMAATLAGEQSAEDGQHGWTDFDSASARSSGTSPDYKPVGESDPDYPRIPERSLYGLEALSYLKYYSREPAYREVRDDLKLRFPEHPAATMLGEFDADETKLLDQIFVLCTKRATKLIKVVFKKPLQIQIPAPINTLADQDKASFYYDGTVAYNFLNALNFFAKYADTSEENRDALKGWKELEERWVSVMLTDGYSESAFTHAHLYSDREDQLAVYATRTAISSLLSWGVAAPGPMRDEAFDLQNTECEELLAELRRRLESKPVATEVRAQWSEEDVRSFLELGMIAGLFVSRLKRVLPNMEHEEYLEVFGKSGAKSKDSQELISLHSSVLLARLGKILTLGEQQAAVPRDKLLTTKKLAMSYEAGLKVLFKTLAQLEPGARAKVLAESIQANLPITFEQEIRDVLGA